jgi:tyrosinase
MANEPRVRRDIQSLMAEGPSGLKVLDDYAAAIASMKALDTQGNPTDPRSWRFQAAIHGFPGLLGTVNHPRHWGSCRHNSWFFLAWHRIYLFYFESVVQSHLGDPTWALPYWDYTKVDDESAQVLPEPFRSPTGGNELFTPERDPFVNDESSPAALPFEFCDARPALALGGFTLDGANPAQSFGGGAVQDTTPNQSARGSLESTPHGIVHGLVGGDTGLMGAFETAGLDPVFWCHHCNLDRLWEVWIAKWGADRLPAQTAWLDTEFEFFDSGGDRAGKRIRDILDTSDLGYVYESTTQPRGTPGPDPSLELAAIEPAAPAEPPELLGAASGVDFSSRTAVEVELAPNERVEAMAAGLEVVAPRWFLRVEDIAGTAPKAPAYNVYLNLPEGSSEDADLKAGSIASFGIPEATDPGAEHGGVGITDTFEITDVVAKLVERADTVFDPAKVTVHVVPVGLRGEVDDGGDVRAGRISIYAG